jgi:hypothetical protein
LLPELTVLEKERKTIVRKLVMSAVMGIAIVIIFFLWGYYKNIQQPFLILVPVAILWYFFSFKKHVFMDGYGYIPTFKNSIIARIVKFVDENLNYSASGCIDESYFTRSNIFNIDHDIYVGNDYICGKIGETEIKFSELFSAFNVSVKGGKYTHVIFKGLFFVADFNKTFTGRIVVLPDEAERLLGHLGSQLQSKSRDGSQIVRLEDSEFEKYFVVYGDDQITARYVLSINLMNRIVDFRKKAGKNIYLSFVNSRIYLAIPYSKNLFEPRLYKTLLDFKPVQEYFENIQFALGIVDELNLNMRIWTKQ